MNQPQPMAQQVAPTPPKQPLVTPWLLIVFIIVLLAGGGYLGWYFYNQSKTPTTTETPEVTEPTTTTPTATTATPLTYTNSTYGFTMTFPATWKGYKMKEATIAGATVTYYVNFPTTDATATESITADKGYYSPFAVSVYTLDQWTAAQAETVKPTLITKNTTHVFGWSQANGEMPTDFTLSSDIATIIASFKLTAAATTTTPAATTTPVVTP